MYCWFHFRCSVQNSWMCIIVTQHSIQSQLLAASFSENEANVVGIWLKQSFIVVLKQDTYLGTYRHNLTILHADCGTSYIPFKCIVTAKAYCTWSVTRLGICHCSFATISEGTSSFGTRNSCMTYICKVSVKLERHYVSMTACTY